MSATYHHPFKRIIRIALLCAAIGLLAGCGASSSPHRRAEQAVPTPAQSNADAGTSYAQVSQAPLQTKVFGSAAPRISSASASHSVHTPGTAVERAKATPAQSNDDVSKTSRTQFNPCSLVSVAEAQAIVGAAITGSIEAPLGPTCVYKLGGSKPDITVAVESLNLSQATRHMTAPKAVVLGARRAYCGRLGTQMLFAPVARGRLLNVTAPCAIAPRLAALALAHLAA